MRNGPISLYPVPRCVRAMAGQAGNLLADPLEPDPNPRDGSFILALSMVGVGCTDRRPQRERSPSDLDPRSARPSTVRLAG